MNSVQIIGNLARDPIIRATRTGRSVASFSVAVNRSYTNQWGETKELTDWVNVVAWGNLAEDVGNRLRKGSRVFVEGRYSTRSYDTQDGQKRYVTEVVANTIAEPLGGGHSSQQAPAQGGYSGGASGGYPDGAGSGGRPPGTPHGDFNRFAEQPQQQTPPPQQTPPQGGDPFPPGNTPQGNDEDIPF